MTAYRQDSLTCAAALRDGEASTRALKAITPEAPGILLRNVYGWFERVSRGVYRLSPAGKLAAAQFEGPDAATRQHDASVVVAPHGPPPT